jgi:putative sterol carrier protein
MAIFVDSEQFYSATKALFARIAEQDPGAADAIQASHLVIRVRSSDPEAEFTINGRQRPLQTTFGPSPVRPTLEIELAADTLHQIMLGEQSMKKALADGRLKVRGPAWKAMALADLFRRGQGLYPEVLREQGVVGDL